MPSVSAAASLPNPPGALPLWAKVLWYLAETVGPGVLWNAFEFGQEIGAAAAGAGEPATTTWRRAQVRTIDVISNDDADDQYFTIDLINYTNGVPDSTWTATDYQQATDAIGDFTGALAPFIPTRYTFSQIAYYIMAFQPYGNLTADGKPGPDFVNSGPPDMVSPITRACTGPGTIAAQPCSTVTEETPSRANWGRFYTPTLGTSAYQVSGRLTTAVVDTVAGAAETMYYALNGNQLIPVVPTTQSQKQKVRVLQGVTGVRVDDVPDIIRRRRPKYPAYRAIRPLAAQQQPAPAIAADEREAES